MAITEKFFFLGIALLAEPLGVGLMRLEGWPHGGDYPKTMDSMCAENAPRERAWMFDSSAFRHFSPMVPTL